MIASANIAEHALQQEQDDGYTQLEEMVRSRINSFEGSLFQTSAADSLFGIFLASIPEDRRQLYRCNCCKKFFERYGALASVCDDGTLFPLIWNSIVDCPDFFRKANINLRASIENAKITDVFLSSEKVWGTPENIGVQSGIKWTHLSGVPLGKPFASPIRSADQEIAEKRQDYIMLKQGLIEYTKRDLDKAVFILEADALDRSEKTLGVAKWLRDLQASVLALSTSRHRDNLIWRAVAAAPAGFCHVRSTMISTLLDDLNNGLDIDTIKDRWAKKMHPLQYQRPKEVDDGNIKQAEEIVAKLGTAGSLARRYARLEEVVKIWAPRPKQDEQPKGEGVFGSLLSTNKPTSEVELPAKTVTREKFQKDVLPSALSIEFALGARFAPFYALVSAVNPDSPPILQWDSEPYRNQVSWFTHASGSAPEDWRLDRFKRHKVTAVCLMPPHWRDAEKFSHQEPGLLFILEGCKPDVDRHELALFPELLRSEYHSIRKVIERYSKSNKMAGLEEASACGICLRKQAQAYLGIQFRVRTEGGIANYIVDRWE